MGLHVRSHQGSANWREPASSQDRGEAYCGSPCRSITEPLISTVKPREKALRDRRDPRMDVVGAGRAFGIRDVATGSNASAPRRLVAFG